MKKTIILVVAVAACTAFARPHHDNDGVRLATDILRLIDAGLDIFRPNTTVVTTAPAVTVTPAVPACTYVIYNGVQVPCYNNFIYVDHNWIWRGVGPAPRPPRFTPPPIHRPAPRTVIKHHQPRRPVHTVRPAPGRPGQPGRPGAGGHPAGGPGRR